MAKVRSTRMPDDTYICLTEIGQNVHHQAQPPGHGDFSFGQNDRSKSHHDGSLYSDNISGKGAANIRYYVAWGLLFDLRLVVIICGDV